MLATGQRRIADYEMEETTQWAILLFAVEIVFASELSKSTERNR